jgi:hypothetical protein
MLVALSALAVAFVWLPRGSRVSLANGQRLKVGMTEAEVFGILGHPWEDSWHDPESPSLEVKIGMLSKGDQVIFKKRLQRQDQQFEPIPPSYGRRSFWIGDGLLVFVAYDEDNRVIFAEVYSDPRVVQSLLPVRLWRRLRSRYGW